MHSGQVKLHGGVLKDDKRKFREKSVSRQNEEHMHTPGNTVL